MIAVLGAFAAGVLTTLAPCVLPLLPVIVGGSVVAYQPLPAGGSVALATRQQTALQRYRGPVIIAVSLAVSIIMFTLVLNSPVKPWILDQGFIPTQ